MGEFIPAFSSAVIFPTTLPLLRQAFVAIRLQGGPHAKAQRIIKTYRRNRMIVCTICALVTLASTLSVRFISQRNLNQQRVVQFANHAVEELDKVLLPLQAGSEVLLPLIGLPCSVAHLPLRKQAAKLQTVRSIGTVQDGTLYCSSILVIAMCPSWTFWLNFLHRNHFYD